MSDYSFKTDKNSMAVVLRSLNNNKNLNEWEEEFIDNVNNRFLGGAPLTDSQLEKLSDLWSKY